MKSLPVIVSSSSLRAGALGLAVVLVAVFASGALAQERSGRSLSDQQVGRDNRGGQTSQQPNSSQSDSQQIPVETQALWLAIELEAVATLHGQALERLADSQIAEFARETRRQLQNQARQLRSFAERSQQNAQSRSGEGYTGENELGETLGAIGETVQQRLRQREEQTGRADGQYADNQYADNQYADSRGADRFDSRFGAERRERRDRRRVERNEDPDRNQILGNRRDRDRNAADRDYQDRDYDQAAQRRSYDRNYDDRNYDARNYDTRNGDDRNDDRYRDRQDRDLQTADDQSGQQESATPGDRVRVLLPALRKHLPEILELVGEAIEDGSSDGDTAWIRFHARAADQVARARQRELQQYRDDEFDAAYLGMALVASLDLGAKAEIVGRSSEGTVRNALDNIAADLDRDVREARRLMDQQYSSGEGRSSQRNRDSDRRDRSR
jgi:hypothetical protein